ncbi:TPA: hypothetical protein ACGO00_001829, partial [Streptococcus suis]
EPAAAGSLFIEKSTSTFFILKGCKFRGTVIFIRRLEIRTALGSFLCIQLLKDDSWLELESGGFYLKFEEGTMEKFSVADSRVLDR